MNDGFWSWMLKVYPREGVSPALISLQDRENLNVNSLLFCCWLACRGLRLTRDGALEIERLDKDWASCIIAPVRTARRHLKASDLIAEDRKADIRKRLQTIELELEEVHAHLIEARVVSMLEIENEPEAREELASDNARQYFAARKLSLADQDRILADAAWHRIAHSVCAE